MFRKLFTILFLLSTVSAAYAQDVKAEFEKILAEKSIGIETIACDFVQVREMAVLAQEVSKNGDFTYSRPGNILLAFDDGDFIRLTDTEFTMKNAGTVTAVKVGSNPMLKELKRILSACMTGDVKMMSSGFSMEVADAEDEYVVTLLPLKGRGAAKMKSVLMHFDKNDMSLTMLKLEEPSGDSIRYEFKNKKFNIEVPKELFQK